MADYKWADLTKWIACLCAADSPNLPAALWLVSTCTAPEKHLQFQGEDRYLEKETATLLDQLRGARDGTADRRYRTFDTAQNRRDPSAVDGSLSPTPDRGDERKGD